MPTATNIDASETVAANKFWSPSDIMIAHCKISKKPDREVDLSISDFWLQLTLRHFLSTVLVCLFQCVNNGVLIASANDGYLWAERRKRAPDTLSGSSHDACG